MIDLTALAARQILRGRCVLARRRLGNFADGRIGIAQKRHAIGFRNGHAFSDEVAQDNGHALTFTSRPYGNCVIADSALYAQFVISFAHNAPRFFRICLNPIHSRKQRFIGRTLARRRGLQNRPD